MFKYLIAALLIVAVSCDETENTKVCKKSWMPFHNADATETGVNLFYLFFQRYPRYKADFPKFKDVSMADLKSNADFRAHATKIYHAIDDAVMNQNWANVEKLSQFHHDIGHTDKDKFEAFRAIFHFMVIEDDFSSAEAWGKCLDKFFHHFYKHF